ncbi:MAG: endonuclease III [Bryobacterales bacterium]|nr:endonuclease III [Bryobacterales bacterium]
MLTFMRPMRPKTAAERKARVARIVRILDETYPNVTCELDHTDAWQLLVATILSAQCTDKRVNMVTPELFRRYPTVTDLAHAHPAEVSELIRTTGFFNNKTKNIIGAARKLLASHGGEVPRTMKELLAVPGAARKTANVVLGTVFGIADGVVVDTHVQRISRRLDLTRETTPERIERDLMKSIPRERWILFSHQLIHHGRRICEARKPKCGECPLESLCYAKDKTV